MCVVPVMCVRTLSPVLSYVRSLSLSHICALMRVCVCVTLGIIGILLDFSRG